MLLGGRQAGDLGEDALAAATDGHAVDHDMALLVVGVPHVRRSPIAEGARQPLAVPIPCDLLLGLTPERSIGHAPRANLIHERGNLRLRGCINRESTRQGQALVGESHGRFVAQLRRAG